MIICWHVMMKPIPALHCCWDFPWKQNGTHLFFSLILTDCPQTNFENEISLNGNIYVNKYMCWLLFTGENVLKYWKFIFGTFRFYSFLLLLLRMCTIVSVTVRRTVDHHRQIHTTRMSAGSLISECFLVTAYRSNVTTITLPNGDTYMQRLGLEKPFCSLWLWPRSNPNATQNEIHFWVMSEVDPPLTHIHTLTRASTNSGKHTQVKLITIIKSDRNN